MPNYWTHVGSPPRDKVAEICAKKGALLRTGEIYYDSAGATDYHALIWVPQSWTKANLDGLFGAIRAKSATLYLDSAEKKLPQTLPRVWRKPRPKPRPKPKP